jgi:glycosyltransferase involved in cell wall biosynthesis
MGRLAKAGDWRSIGEAVMAVLQDPAQYHRSRQEIEAIFSFQETVDRYESIFREYARN